MIFLPQSLVLSTLLLSALSSPTPQDHQRQQQQEQHPQPCHGPADPARFQRLLAGVDESSIHSALHLLSPKFKDGVFSHDRTALEAVHSENAPLATSLLLHIAKRQTNTTIPDSSPTPQPPTDDPESQPPNDEPSPPPAPEPSPPIPDDDNDDDNNNPDPTPTPPPSTSNGIVVPGFTRTTATRAPTTEAIPVSTPASATPIATTDGRVVFSISPTADDADGQGALTTVDASSGLVSFSPSSSTVLSTFTLPDGSVNTLTSVTVVDAPVTGGGLGAPAVTGTAGAGSPGLQEGGGAGPTRKVWREVLVVVGGAVVVGLAM